jgi:hypothetical protein
VLAGLPKGIDQLGSLMGSLMVDAVEDAARDLMARARRAT